MLVLEFGFGVAPRLYITLAIFLTAYLLAGWDVVNLAFRNAIRFDFFNEFSFDERGYNWSFHYRYFWRRYCGYGVLLFGRMISGFGCEQREKNIKSLLDSRPDTVNLIRDGQTISMPLSEIAIGLATLLEAVIADVGVALLAILNAVRIQNKKL